MTWLPCLIREADRGGRPVLRLGHAQLDRYLDFVAARARPNTVLATGYDLKVFFTVVAKDPIEVTTSDVLGFITAQRGDRRVVRLADGESGLSARTIPATVVVDLGPLRVLVGVWRGRKRTRCRGACRIGNGPGRIGAHRWCGRLGRYPRFWNRLRSTG